MLQLQEHDQAHLDYLSDVLVSTNNTVPQPCAWPTLDLLLSLGLEDTMISLCGIEQFVQSAYLGFEQQLHDPTEGTVVSQLASSEARHQGWVLASILKEDPWS